MILLKKIQLNNFLSHENTSIDFASSEKVLFDGSSGAGKSSIFDAIIWAIYGVSRADNRSLIRKGTKMAQVTLQLQKDDDITTIKRTITSIGKHNLVVTQTQEGGPTTPFVVSGVREIQNWIEKDLIGASYLLFINSVAYVQGNADSFVMQTASKRKELLLEIVKSEDYSKYYENARQTLSTLGNEQNMASGKIIELEAHLESLASLINTRSEHIKTLTTNSGLINALEPQIQILEAEKSKLLAISQNIENLDTSLKNAISDMNDAQESLDKHINKISVKKSLQDTISAAPNYKENIEVYNKKITESRDELISVSSIHTKRNEVLSRKPVINDRNFQEIESIKVKINKIENQPICPSGELCPYSGDHSKIIEGFRGDIVVINTVIASETRALEEWTKEFYALPEIVDLDTIIKRINKLEKDLKNVELESNNLETIKIGIAAIEEIEANIPGLEAALEEKKTRVMVAKRNREIADNFVDNGEVERIMDELVDMRNKKELIKESITRATAALENIDKNEEEVKFITGKISSLRKEMSDLHEKTRKVELIKSAFGSKGIETLVIDYLLPRLEDKINEVLSKLSDFRVRLDTQKKSVDGENMLEGMFITIINESNEEMSFENYSGGEKLKISVAISEALATLQKVGFRLFDETFLGLDENSTESFARVLEKLQRNFSQVLCISHLLQIKDLFDKKINIIKTKSISYVN